MMLVWTEFLITKVHTCGTVARRPKTVICRHSKQLASSAQRPAVIVSVLNRQHRRKRHTKRAGEAGVSSRARGLGEGPRSSRQ